MTAYRFRRRAFFAAVGGAFGLKILLRNLEASAAGGTSPPRFLLAHWPNGTVRTQFVPTGTGTSYVASPILQPFEDKGLRSDMISLFGFNHSGITTHGGGAEGGTVIATTGASSPGNRQNGGEADDAVAGGPSWDQILLKHVPALAPRDASGAILGPGSVSAICDARVDSLETSSRCLSYDYATRSINSSVPGGVITEHTPRPPVLSPATLYATLFSGFMPGGNADATLRALRMRKSVLDSTLRELARLNELAPASERVKIEAHTQAIRELERAISDRIADGGTGGCVVPEGPPPTMIGKTGDRVLDFQSPVATEADDETHEAVGKLHMSVIRAAFQCDLIRVATFQWAPGTGHVALRGLDPNAPDVIYRYRGLGMRGLSSSFWSNPRPTTDAYIWDAIVNAHIWYSRRMADILAEFKNATDAFGGNLLDHTVIPYVTEMANPSFARSPIPALVFGGRALGMQGGQFQSVTGLHNDLWATVAQAYLGSDPMSALADEVFVKTGVAPIPNLWFAPV
jgi:hypothetical protein